MLQFIIVANGKTEALMAKRIHAIISQDERFEALCWSEKQYKASEQTISSSQKCLFIGETSVYKANSFSDGIKWRYDHYGMKYGWIGAKGFLIVDKKEKLSGTQTEELKEILERFFGTAKEIEDKKKQQDEKIKLPKFLDAAKNAFMFTPLFVGAGAAMLIGGAVGAGYFINDKLDSQKLFEAQYIYLINEFCVNGLAQFMGETE